MTSVSHKPSIVTLLTIAVVLLSLLPPSVFLVCQGRSCGTTFGYCCCPVPDREPGHSSVDVHAPSPIVCHESLTATRCDCHDFFVCVDKEAPFFGYIPGGLNASAASYTLPSSIAAIPGSTYLDAPCPNTVEPRGPPKGGPVPYSHFLRAPPVA